MPRHERWPLIQIEESYEKTCDECDKLIEMQLFFHWGHKDFNLCSDCLQKLYEDVFTISGKGVSSIYTKTPIPEETRQFIYERDNFTCQYCGADRNLSIDHIRPESRGGTMVHSNLVTACRPCNSKKSDRTPEEAGMNLMNDPRK